MFLRQRFSEISSFVRNSEATRELGPSWTAGATIASAGFSQTVTGSNVAEAPNRPKLAHFAAWLERLCQRSVEEHVARAAKGHLWPWP